MAIGPLYPILVDLSNPRSVSLSVCLCACLSVSVSVCLCIYTCRYMSGWLSSE